MIDPTWYGILSEMLCKRGVISCRSQTANLSAQDLLDDVHRIYTSKYTYVVQILPGMIQGSFHICPEILQIIKMTFGDMICLCVKYVKLRF